MKYDFCGNVTQSQETHWRTGIPELSLSKEFHYNDRGQLIYCRETVNNIVHSTSLYYDQQGRVEATLSGPMEEYYEYTLQGWLKGVNVLRDADDLYDWTGNYSFGGQLSSVTKHHATDFYEHEGYTQFNYDGLGRLILANNTQNDDQGGFSEQQSYDRNGNVTFIHRNNNGAVQQLSLFYAGNRLDSLIKNGNTVRFQHNANGAVAYDGNQGLFLQYNLQGLPITATDTSGLINTHYSYLSGGEKISVTRANGSSLKYRGSFIYKKTPGKDDKLERILTSYGSIISIGEDQSGNAILANYHFLKDYNKNVIAVIDLDNNYDYIQEKVKEENEYFPYGQKVVHSWMPMDTTNRYRFGEKEEQKSFGINYVDFGARLYDPSISRWVSPDPLAVKDPSVSVYSYCSGDPINKIDQNGLWVKDSTGVLKAESGDNAWTLARFLGTSPEIAKIMLLEQGYKIDSRGVLHLKVGDPFYYEEFITEDSENARLRGLGKIIYHLSGERLLSGSKSTQSLFKRYWDGGNDYQLTNRQFAGILMKIESGLVRVKPITQITLAGNSDKTYPGFSVLANFYSDPEYKYAFGTATLYANQKGEYVGFKDEYNFNKMKGSRTTKNEIITRVIGAISPDSATDFIIRYGYQEHK